MTMKMTTRTSPIHTVKVADYNDFVSLTYGLPMDIDENEDRDIPPRYRDIGKNPLSSYESCLLEEIKTYKEYPLYCTRAILQDLCHRGIIPAGDYVLEP